MRVVGGEVVDQFQIPRAARGPRSSPKPRRCTASRTGTLPERPPTAEALASFLDWLDGDWMAAHDAQRDARVLGFELARARLPLPDAPMLDTLRLARKLIPEAARPPARDPLRRRSTLEDGEHHRALPDAVWAFKVLEACAERLGPPAYRRTPARRPPAGHAGHDREPRPVDPPLRMKPRWRPLVAACEPGTKSSRCVYGSERRVAGPAQRRSRASSTTRTRRVTSRPSASRPEPSRPTASTASTAFSPDAFASDPQPRHRRARRPRQDHARRRDVPHRRHDPRQRARSRARPRFERPGARARHHHPLEEHLHRPGRTPASTWSTRRATPTSAARWSASSPWRTRCCSSSTPTRVRCRRRASSCARPSSTG